MTDTKHNHYIPQFYLRKFCTCGEQLTQFDIRTGKQVLGAPRIFGAINRLYPMPLERYLAEEIESPANTAIENLLSRCSPLSLQDRFAIAKYISVLQKRVPAWAEWVDERVEVNNIFAYQESQLLCLRGRNPSHDDIIETLLRQIKDRREQFSNSVWHEVVPAEATPKIWHLIVQMGWQIISAEEGKLFITCDNPVVFDVTNGLKSSRGYLDFPLSSKILLHASWENGGGIEFVVASPGQTKAFNKSIISNADIYLFGDPKAIEIATRQ